MHAGIRDEPDERGVRDAGIDGAPGVGGQDDRIGILQWRAVWIDIQIVQMEAGRRDSLRQGVTPGDVIAERRHDHPSRVQGSGAAHAARNQVYTSTASWMSWKTFPCPPSMIRALSQ
ncbi:hypothetical protein D3C73_1181580 [compost metagenome]